MKWILLFALATPLLMGACHTVNTSVPKTKSPIGINDSINVEYIHSDSLDRIIMQASDISFYEMEGFFGDSVNAKKKDSLFNYAIKKDYGKLNKSEKELFYFVLGDGKEFLKNYAPIKQPFHPNFTLAFSKGKEIVFLFVSLGTGEIAIVDENSNFSFYLMKDAEFIERWYDYVLTKRTK